MTVKEIYENLLRARRPIDFYGDVTCKKDITALYRKYAKTIHPDVVKPDERYIAGEAFKLLRDLCVAGEDEYDKGIYAVIDPVEVYKFSTPLFELDIKGEEYKFYEYITDGEVASVFRGTDSSGIVYIKVGRDPDDNHLIETEFEVLSTFRHGSLPFVDKKIKVNDTMAIIMREVEGISMAELMRENPRGVPARHVMWMMERLLSVVGYLHYNRVVHGNIKPEHLIINKETHNVSLLGFSFCIPKADTSDAEYKVKNPYSAPEVNKTAQVMPGSDIYSLGKIAIELLGGDIRNNGMPTSVDARVRTFFRKMVDTSVNNRPNDAWDLWHQLKNLRTEVFGSKRFEEFN
ncbi:MAG: protein kinase domain-containing protein [Ignavibacteriales bacterium]